MNKKQTYKLYKAKKLWVTALAGVSMVAVEGAHQQAQADDVSSSQTTKKTTDTNESTSQQSQTASSQITNNQSTGSQSSVAQGLNPQSTAAQGLNPTSTTSQSAASQSTGTQQSSTSAGEQGAQQTATLQGTTTAQNQSQAASNTSSSTANNNNQSQSTSAGSGTQSQSTSTSSATQSQSQETGSTTDSSTAGSSTTDATSGSNQGSQSQATEQTLDLREATDSATNNTALLGANLTQGTTQPVTNDNLSVTVTKDNFLQWFKLGGDTTYDASTNTATLTPDIGGVEGNITLKTKINANDAFVLHGTINLGSKLQDAQGADGIGIAFHHGTVGEIGSLGGGISVLGLPTSSGYVFDTWPIDGGDHYDGKDSYVSGFHSDVDQKGQDSNIRYDGGFLDLDPTKYPVAGKAMPFTVTYDGNGHMGLDYLGHTFSIPVTDPQDPLALSIGASTGLDSNLQTVSVDSFTFDPAQNNTISRTINYVDKSGNKIASSTVQSAIYRRQGTLVNGQPTYTDWQLASGANSNNFAAVTAPTIAGYTIEGSQPTYFDSTTVNNDSGQLAYNVVYDKVLGQATLNVQDSTIVAGPTAQWSASQNFLSAVDQNGSAVDLSKVQVSGSVKTTDPGTYPIIYTYTDTSGKAVTKTANVTVVPSQSSLKAKDSTILVNSKWNTSDNVVSATDENGNILDLSKVQVSGNVDTSTPGVYPVTYSYTDASGNQHTQPVTVTVINSQSTLTVKDSTIFVNDSWKPADNVTAAKDEYGNPVDISKISVSGDVNTSKAGVYPVTYSYTDGQGKSFNVVAKVTVEDNQTQLQAKNSTLIAGLKTTWQPSDNLQTAIDADGKPLSIDQVQVSGSVNPQKPGTYQVTYSYTDQQGHYHSTPATITVLASQGSINATGSTIVAGPKAQWSAKDNFLTATDEHGNAVDFSQVQTTGTVDTKTPGVYPITYTYTDSQGTPFTKTINVTVVASKEGVVTKDETLIAGPKTQWQSKDDFVSAADANGNAVDLSQVAVSANVDTNTPGKYAVTYTYTDKSGNAIPATAEVTVLKSKAAVVPQDSTLIAGPNTTWLSKDNIADLLDEYGNSIDTSQASVSGSVNAQKPGTYSVTYSYTDGQGNLVSNVATITVVASQGSLTTQTVNLVAGPQTQWYKQQNLKSATDENGHPVNINQITVSGTVNPHQAGTYPLTYSYTDDQGNTYTQPTEVIVAASQAGIQTKDETIVAGPQSRWSSYDNMVKATDEDGNPLSENQVTVTGQADPSKVGTYTITYSYTDGQGNSITQPATVKVVQTQASISATDSTLIAGPNTKWNPASNFAGAKDENGQSVSYGSQISTNSGVDTEKPNTYLVIYSYQDAAGNTVSSTAKITVLASQGGVAAKDSTLIAGPNTKWTAADNFTSATDENGQPVDLSKVTVDGKVDPTTPGTYPVTYSYTDVQGNPYSKKVTVAVLASQGGVAAKDSTLIAGPNTKWTAADNFTSATDEDGKPVDLSKVTVDGSVDPTKAGSYPVTYSYTDAQGNPYSQKVTVTVVASQGGVAAKDSTLIAGPNTKWTAADNFSGATDEDGKPVDLSKVTVDGKVDPTTPGTYPVTYSYTDAQGNPYSKKITVTVVASQGGVAAKDSTMIAGPNTKWTAADNFTSATDENGKPVNLSKVKVDGKVDPTTPGTYSVTYSYTDAQGNPYSQKVTVTVNPSKGGVAAKDSTLIAGPNTKWTAADNFSGATDENGNPVDLSKVTVDGGVDTTKAGSYPVTYSYTDAQGNPYSQKITVTVVSSKGGVAAKDSTLIAGPNTKWTAADNFTGATDEDGKPVDLSKLTVDGKVDPTTPGTYPVTYSYTDDQGNPYSQKVTVTVNPSKGGVAAKDSTLIAGPNTKWTAADNFTSATDENGKPVDFSKVTVDGSVDPTKAGSYPVTYSYTDAQGNPYSQKVTVTVNPSKGGVAAKDSTLIAGPNTKWTAADNFSGATDEDDKPVDLSKVTVDGSVDPTKAGSYPVTYSYTDAQGNPYSQKVTVTVNPSRGGVAAKDSTLIAEPNTKWTAADNFTSATDENGKPVDLSKVTVDGKVDPTTPGTYPVTYSYTDDQGNPYSQKVTVTVNPSRGGVAAKDSTLIAGPNTKWTAADNFTSATDENGQPVDLSKVTVDGKVDPTTPGTYPVTYSYTDAQGNPYSQKVTVTVNPSRGGVAAKDSTLIAGPNTKWTAADNFTSATDENGKPVDLSKVTVDGSVNPNKAGSYPVTYSYTDAQGNPYSQKVTVTVNPSKGGVAAKDSTLIAGPNTKWTPADNFSGATDENGQPVDLSKVTVDGSVNPNKAGSYPVTYSYTDAQGNPYSQKVTVTVNPSKGGVAAKDSTLIAGPNTKWTAADNFSGATDEDGKPVDLSKVTVDGSVDPTTPGTYPVTYSYTDAQGNPYSQKITVTVVSSKDSITMKDSTLIAGPNTRWTPADNFSGATDANGQPIDLSKITVTGHVDTTKPGTYPVTYSYTDETGNHYSKTVTVTVNSSKGSLTAKDSTLIAGPDTKWTPADNFSGATDENGQPVDLSKVTVDGTVDTTKPGSYPITYTYTDGEGNTHSQKVTVTVNPSKGSLTAKDSTLIAGPDTKWTPADNFSGATDENGQPVDLSKVTVDGKVDPTTPGTYPVTYSYTDAQGNKQSQTATITVVASKDSITIKGGNLIAGPSTKWTPADSFSGATDANGQPIDLTKITVTGHVDTTKPGTYPVTYSYTDETGNHYSKTVTITVTQSKGGITTKDSHITVAPNTNWSPADGFSGATDENGQPVGFSKIKVTGQVDTTKPGTYPVTYSYTDGSGNIYTQTVTVTVTSGNDTTSNTNQGSKTTPSSSGQSTTQGSEKTPSNSGQSTTQKSETSSTIATPSQVNTSDSLVNATPKTTSVLPQTGKHQTRSMDLEALEIGMISATFGLILLMKRNKKNGID